MFSSKQAHGAGWPPASLTRAVKAGIIERLLPRIYRFTDRPDTWETRPMAAQLWAGTGGAISGPAAAVIWGLLEPPPTGIDVTSTRDLKSPRGWITVHGTRAWNRFDVVQKAPFVVTHPCRTLLDLSAWADGEDAETALNVAMHHRLVAPERLLKYVAQLNRGTPGLAMLKQMLDRRSSDRRVPTNHFETKLMTVLRKAGLPMPEPQYRVMRPNGRPAFIDFAYPFAMLAIEADGYEDHGGYEAWAKDRARRNELEALGWRVLQITYRQLREHPDEVVRLIRSILFPVMFRT